MRKALLLLLIISSFFSACKKDKSDDTPEVTPLNFEEEIVTINPFPDAPLSALIQLKTNRESKLEVTINGALPLTHQFPETSQYHEHAIHGLYPDKLNEVIFRLSDDNSNVLLDTLYLQTFPLPDFFPEIEINTSNNNLMEPGWTLCDYSSGKMSHLETYPFMFDENGDIRWYLDLSKYGNLVMPITRLRNGNIAHGFQDQIFEITMLGTTVNTWPISGFKQHHDIVEKANGNLLVAVNNVDISTIEDHLIELDRNSGSIINTWDLRKILDVNRTVAGGNDFDWFHMNSIWPDESDDGLIISGKSQGIVKVSANNELEWILGPHKEWGNAGVNGDGIETSNFLLTAVDANGTPYSEAIQLGDEKATDFDWTWGQHAAMKLVNGNILAFDNGNERGYGIATSNYSRIVEYEIDESNKTVKQVATFGENYGEDLYSRILSDVDEHQQTGNQLMNSGIIWNGGDSYSKILELNAVSSEIIFDADVKFKNLDSSNEFIWHRFDFLYRSERTRLYMQ